MTDAAKSFEEQVFPLTEEREIPFELKETPIPLTRKKGEAHTALVFDREGRVVGLKNEQLVTAQEAWTAIAAKLRDIDARIVAATGLRQAMETTIDELEGALKEEEARVAASTEGAGKAEAAARLDLMKEDLASRRAELKELDASLDALSNEAAPWITFQKAVDAAYESPERGETGEGEGEMFGGEGGLAVPNPFYEEGAEDVSLQSEEPFDRNAAYDAPALIDWQEKFYERRSALKERLDELERREREFVTRAGEIHMYDPALREEQERKEKVAREAVRAAQEGRMVTEFGQKGMRQELREEGLSEKLSDVNDEMQDVLSELKRVNDDISFVQKKMAGDRRT